MSIPTETLLTVSGLRVTAAVDGELRPLVAGVDLSVSAGETVAIVGESGSGKSMTARALMGLLPAGVTVDGSVRYRGDELLPGSRGRRLHEDFAMIFQDPFTMLNPLLPSGRHISETLRDGRGRRLRGAAARAVEIERLAEVGIHDPSVATRYPFELSGGMRQRVGIAATLASNPTLLIADEVTTALDVTTQAEILQLLRSVQRARNVGMILITHDLSVAFSMADRVYVLYAGQLLEQAPSARMLAEPLHPYTRGLLESDPPLDHRAASLYSMPGSVPQAASVLHRCPFADRCAWVTDDCRAGATPLREVGGETGRLSACIRIEEIRPQVAAASAPASVSTATAVDAGTDGEGSDAFLSVVGLRKEFTRGGRTVVALDGVSIEVAAGESVGIVGESGSGKTTLGRSIVGLETPSDGSIRIGGVDASDYESLGHGQVAQLRSAVQMAFQDPFSTLSPARSIGSVLREALRLDDPRASTADVAELLALVGLPASYARRKPASLSGGERQRVALARALARKPRLIVCDEIVSALDVSVQAQILNLLNRLRAELGVGYVFITHDLAVVRQITDRVYVLHRGRLVEHGPTGSVLDEPREEYTRSLVASVPQNAIALP
ncbi:ABC transporter ATP-binding protein [Leifsonia sp. Root227]|uniref:dipeptide ABC transporter ATP-binding protein n=1 Tax=Leifsonia sp. Root227 TaxID=1736496 RepID=UPI0006F4CB13|nr:ABC transporter ATP-binding protein [Leifsonia sp. Root227]KRC49670.1 ABC transporter ATP-binding protein [Leifsonia sp. Root227]